MIDERLEEFDLKGSLLDAYDRTTPDSALNCLYVVIVVLMAFSLVSTFSIGVLSGASSSLSDGTIDGKVTDVDAIELETWVDMTAGGQLVRSVYGLFHWFIVLAVKSAVIGLELGYQYPVVAFVLDPAVEALPFITILLVGIQLTRLFELVLRGAEVIE